MLPRLAATEDVSNNYILMCQSTIFLCSYLNLLLVSGRTWGQQKKKDIFQHYHVLSPVIWLYCSCNEISIKCCIHHRRKLRNMFNSLITAFTLGPHFIYTYFSDHCITTYFFSYHWLYTFPVYHQMSQNI